MERAESQIRIGSIVRFNKPDSLCSHWDLGAQKEIGLRIVSPVKSQLIFLLVQIMFIKKNLYVIKKIAKTYEQLGVFSTENAI